MPWDVGRFIPGAKLVNESIESGEIFESKSWRDIVFNCIKNNSVLHFIGLLSDGNVHSNINHMKSMIIKAKEFNLNKVRIHILLDGRDVPATSATTYIDDMKSFYQSLM